MKNTIIIFTFLMLLVLSGRSAKGQGAGQAPSSDLSTLALTD